MDEILASWAEEIHDRASEEYSSSLLLSSHDNGPFSRPSELGSSYDRFDDE